MAPAGLPASTVLVAPLINAASDLALAAHGPAPAASGRGSRSPTHKSYSSQWTAMKYFRPDSVQLQMFIMVTPITITGQT